MKKKLLSILLTGTMVASMGALATMSASAAVDANGAYVPGEDVECGTYRYYFAMPKSWENEMSTQAGIYWYGGTDACGAVDGSGNSYAWPGYKAHEAGYETEKYTLYYVDCPRDVETIIWNNYIDGGLDESAPQYSLARQTTDIPSGFIAMGDGHTIYDDDFLAAMEDSYTSDMAAIGEFEDSFYYDEEYDAGFVMNKNNMIYIVPNAPTGTNDLSGMPTFTGEWYFYYGEGEYGTYPTKEAAQAAVEAGEENALFSNLGEEAAIPTVPAEPSTDPTSATKPATKDEAANNDNGSIPTGEASHAFGLLAVLASLSGVVVFARKKYN